MFGRFCQSLKRKAKRVLVAVPLAASSAFLLKWVIQFGAKFVSDESITEINSTSDVAKATHALVSLAFTALLIKNYRDMKRNEKFKRYTQAVFSPEQKGKDDEEEKETQSSKIKYRKNKIEVGLRISNIRERIAATEQKAIRRDKHSVITIYPGSDPGAERYSENKRSSNVGQNNSAENKPAEQKARTTEFNIFARDAFIVLEASSGAAAVSWGMYGVLTTYIVPVVGAAFYPGCAAVFLTYVGFTYLLVQKINEDLAYDQNYLLCVENEKDSTETLRTEVMKLYEEYKAVKIGFNFNLDANDLALLNPQSCFQKILKACMQNKAVACFAPLVKAFNNGSAQWYLIDCVNDAVKYNPTVYNIVFPINVSLSIVTAMAGFIFKRHEIAIDAISLSTMSQQFMACVDAQNGLHKLLGKFDIAVPQLESNVDTLHQQANAMEEAGVARLEAHEFEDPSEEKPQQNDGESTRLMTGIMARERTISNMSASSDHPTLTLDSDDPIVVAAKIEMTVPRYIPQYSDIPKSPKTAGQTRRLPGVQFKKIAETSGANVPLLQQATMWSSQPSVSQRPQANKLLDIDGAIVEICNPSRPALPPPGFEEATRNDPPGYHALTS
jgi:hypothetical protein